MLWCSAARRHIMASAEHPAEAKRQSLRAQRAILEGRVDLLESACEKALLDGVRVLRHGVEEIREGFGDCVGIRGVPTLVEQQHGYNVSPD